MLKNVLQMQLKVLQEKSNTKKKKKKKKMWEQNLK